MEALFQPNTDLVTAYHDDKVGRSFRRMIQSASDVASNVSSGKTDQPSFRGYAFRLMMAGKFADAHYC